MAVARSGKDDLRTLAGLEELELRQHILDGVDVLEAGR
jgi:hypothetical protein